MSRLDRFEELVKYDVKDCNRIRFWHDKWCRRNFLTELYPKLYAIALDKDPQFFLILILEGQVGWTCSWNIRFIHDFNDRDLELMVSFIDILYSKIPKILGPDRMRWRLNGNGRFDVWSYEVLRGSSDLSFPWECIWCVKA